MTGRLKRRLKTAAALLVLWSIAFLITGYSHGKAYEELLDGHTDKAVGLLRFVFAYEPGFCSHRGKIGKKKLIAEFKNTADIIDKRLEWIVEYEAPVTASPAFKNNSVFTGCGETELCRYDIKDGTVIWKYDASAKITSKPGVKENAVFAVAKNGIHAIDIETGTGKWHYPGETENAALLLSSGVIYTGFANGSFVAIDSRSGDDIWKFKTNKSITSPATIFSGHVFFGDIDGTVYALNARNGVPAWKYELGDTIKGKPLALGNSLYIAGMNGKVVSLDPETGVPQWVQEMNSPILAGAIGNSDVIVVGTKKSVVYGLHPATGKMRWRYNESGPITSDMTIDGDTLYVGCGIGFLSALDVKTGKLKWRFLTGWDIAGSSPLVTEKHIIFGSTDGRLYALRKSEDG